MEEAQHLGELLSKAPTVSMILPAELRLRGAGRGKILVSEGGPIGERCRQWVPENNAKDRFSGG